MSGLNYLIFDHSEDTEGLGTFEAMASVTSPHIAAVQDEVAQVLAWAHAAFPQGHGPLEEGFAWDHDLQARQEPTAGGTPLHTINLSLSGSEAFCRAFRERFPED